MAAAHPASAAVCWQKSISFGVQPAGIRLAQHLLNCCVRPLDFVRVRAPRFLLKLRMYTVANTTIVLTLHHNSQIWWKLVPRMFMSASSL
jgi:hypothetical protein